MIAADGIVQAIKDRGCKIYCFGGGTVAPLFDAAHRLGVETIVFRTEAGAIFAAIGASKAQDYSVKFVVVTSGPGFTNAVTGLADAYFDSVPIVLLAGQVGTSNLVGLSRQQGFQGMNAVDVAKPIAKLSVEPRTSADLVDCFMAGIDIALQPRKGSVFVSACMDLQRGEI